MMLRPDVIVTDIDSVVMFLPVSSRSLDWLEQNVITDPWQWEGASLETDSRYAGALIEALGTAGMVVEVRSFGSGREYRRES